MLRNITLLALAFAGCTFAPSHANLSAYEKDLRLTIRPVVGSVRAGDRFQIEFTIQNTGNRELTACRYRDSWVHFWGLESKYVKTRPGPLVDHQYCEVRMNIAPHQGVQWSEVIEVPKVQAGPSKVMA